MTSPLQRHLPNAISVLRVLLVPAWVLAAERAVRLDEIGDAGTWRWAPLAILVGIGLSDVVDGFLARRWEVSSRAGATLDAVADKLAQVVGITWLALRDQSLFTPVPLWFLGLLVARDLLLGGGLLALWLRRHGGEVEVVHCWHGKLSSVLLFLLMVGCNAGLDPFHRVQPAVFGGLGLLIAASTASYFRDGLRQLPPRPTATS